MTTELVIVFSIMALITIITTSLAVILDKLSFNKGRCRKCGEEFQTLEKTVCGCVMCHCEKCGESVEVHRFVIPSKFYKGMINGRVEN